MYRFFALLCAAVTVATTAVVSAGTGGTIALYSFSVANAPKDAFSTDGRMHVRIMRWSTDEDRRHLLATLHEPSRLLGALPYVPVNGYLQWPGGLEHSVRYARQATRPDGSSDIVMVVERPLWLWWDTTARWAADQQFTVVHLRINKDGTGEGRIGTGDGIKRDSDLGIVVTDITRPPLLTNVRRESVK